MLGRAVRVSLDVLVVVAGLLAAVVAAWLIDDAIVHDGQVVRNVEIAGRPIGGLGEGDLAAALDDLGGRVGETDFTLAAPDRSLVEPNDAVGVSLAAQPIAADALAMGRSGVLLDDFLSWANSFVEPRTVATVYAFDRDAFATWLAARDDTILAQPLEPYFSGRDGPITVTPGVSGAHIDVAAATEAAASAVEAGGVPFTVDVQWSELPPAVTPAAVAAGLEEAEELVARPLTVRVGTNLVRVGRETVRRWIDSAREGERLVPVLDKERIAASMERLLVDFTTEGTPPEFAIVDGEVQVDVGTSPLRCCRDGVGDVVARALEAGTRGAIALPLVPVADPEEIAANLGIHEVVGEFTTNHQCCQSRVTNIHRMADIVRGAIIEPGGSFSINDYVGRRTTEDGFVPAGSIQLGRFKDDVGGGVSQFATTLFNAAFFAGLDFAEYQSHSIYISRYPYGREATVSYPAPDLEVVNNTPYGMLVWTEYTDTSITVQLWSTPYYEVVETGQSSYRQGACTRVETFRQRTDPEGRVVDDMVFAVYRPGEGLDCAGRPTPIP